MTVRSEDTYVHGYSGREAQRLEDQAASVRELIHHDTVYPPGANILEVACGVGAQTETVAGRSPESHFISFDVVLNSVRQAAVRVRTRRLTNVHLLVADLFAFPFRPATFEHLFASYVLEHIPDPLRTLLAVREALKPGPAISRQKSTLRLPVRQEYYFCRIFQERCSTYKILDKGEILVFMY